MTLGKKLLTILFGIILSLPLGALPEESAPPKQVYSAGSGYFATSDGYILTNRHVVLGASEPNVIIELVTGERIVGSIVFVSPTEDIALVKADISTPHTCLPISEQRLEPGTAFIALMLDMQDGQKFNAAYWIEQPGTVRSLIPAMQPHGSSITTLYAALTQDFVRPGNSGSAVIDPTTKEVLGMIFAAYTNGVGGAILQSADIHKAVQESGKSIVCTNPASEPLDTSVRIYVRILPGTKSVPLSNDPVSTQPNIIIEE